MSQDIVDMSTDNGAPEGSTDGEYVTVVQFDVVHQQCAAIAERVAQNSTDIVQNHTDMGTIVQEIRAQCATKADVAQAVVGFATKDQVEQAVVPKTEHAALVARHTALEQKHDKLSEELGPKLKKKIGEEVTSGIKEAGPQIEAFVKEEMKAVADQRVRPVEIVASEAADKASKFPADLQRTEQKLQDQIAQAVRAAVTEASEKLAKEQGAAVAAVSEKFAREKDAAIAAVAKSFERKQDAAVAAVSENFAREQEKFAKEQTEKFRSMRDTLMERIDELEGTNEEAVRQAQEQEWYGDAERQEQEQEQQQTIPSTKFLPERDGAGGEKIRRADFEQDISGIPIVTSQQDHGPHRGVVFSEFLDKHDIFITGDFDLKESLYVTAMTGAKFVVVDGKRATNSKGITGIVYLMNRIGVPIAEDDDWSAYGGLSRAVIGAIVADPAVFGRSTITPADVKAAAVDERDGCGSIVVAIMDEATLMVDGVSINAYKSQDLPTVTLKIVDLKTPTPELIRQAHTEFERFKNFRKKFGARGAETCWKQLIIGEGKNLSGICAEVYVELLTDIQNIDLLSSERRQPITNGTGSAVDFGKVLDEFEARCRTRGKLERTEVIASLDIYLTKTLPNKNTKRETPAEVKTYIQDFEQTFSLLMSARKESGAVTFELFDLCGGDSDRIRFYRSFTQGISENLQMRLDTCLQGKDVYDIAQASIGMAIKIIGGAATLRAGREAGTSGPQGSAEETPSQDSRGRGTLRPQVNALAETYGARALAQSAAAAAGLELTCPNANGAGEGKKKFVFCDGGGHLARDCLAWRKDNHEKYGEAFMKASDEEACSTCQGKHPIRIYADGDTVELGCPCDLLTAEDKENRTGSWCNHRRNRDDPQYKEFEPWQNNWGSQRAGGQKGGKKGGKKGKGKQPAIVCLKNRVIQMSNPNDSLTSTNGPTRHLETAKAGEGNRMKTRIAGERNFIWQLADGGNEFANAVNDNGWRYIQESKLTPNQIRNIKEASGRAGTAGSEELEVVRTFELRIATVDMYTGKEKFRWWRYAHMPDLSEDFAICEQELVRESHLYEDGVWLGDHCVQRGKSLPEYGTEFYKMNKIKVTTAAKKITIQPGELTAVKLGEFIDDWPCSTQHALLGTSNKMFTTPAQVVCRDSFRNTTVTLASLSSNVVCLVKADLKKEVSLMPIQTNFALGDSKECVNGVKELESKNWKAIHEQQEQETGSTGSTKQGPACKRALAGVEDNHAVDEGSDLPRHFITGEDNVAPDATSRVPTEKKGSGNIMRDNHTSMGVMRDEGWSFSIKKCESDSGQARAKDSLMDPFNDQETELGAQKAVDIQLLDPLSDQTLEPGAQKTADIGAYIEELPEDDEQVTGEQPANDDVQADLEEQPPNSTAIGSSKKEVTTDEQNFYAPFQEGWTGAQMSCESKDPVKAGAVQMVGKRATVNDESGNIDEVLAARNKNAEKIAENWIKFEQNFDEDLDYGFVYRHTSVKGKISNSIQFSKKSCRPEGRETIEVSARFVEDPKSVIAREVRVPNSTGCKRIEDIYYDSHNVRDDETPIVDATDDTKKTQLQEIAPARSAVANPKNGPHSVKDFACVLAQATALVWTSKTTWCEQWDSHEANGRVIRLETRVPIGIKEDECIVPAEPITTLVITWKSNPKLKDKEQEFRWMGFPSENKALERYGRTNQVCWHKASKGYKAWPKFVEKISYEPIEEHPDNEPDKIGKTVRSASVDKTKCRRLRPLLKVLAQVDAGGEMLCDAEVSSSESDTEDEPADKQDEAKPEQLDTGQRMYAENDSNGRSMVEHKAPGKEMWTSHVKKRTMREEFGESRQFVPGYGEMAPAETIDIVVGKHGAMSENMEFLLKRGDVPANSKRARQCPGFKTAKIDFGDDRAGLLTFGTTDWKQLPKAIKELSRMSDFNVRMTNESGTSSCMVDHFGPFGKCSVTGWEYVLRWIDEATGFGGLLGPFTTTNGETRTFPDRFVKIEEVLSRGMVEQT